MQKAERGKKRKETSAESERTKPKIGRQAQEKRRDKKTQLECKVDNREGERDKH